MRFSVMGNTTSPKIQYEHMDEARYLISIGINDYEAYPLNYCVKDSNDVSNCMRIYCKVQSKNSYSIISDFNQPNPSPYESLLNIQARIKSVFIEKQDSIFLYFSGHGVKSSNSTSLLFKDKIVELQELFALFTSFKPKFIFFLVDSCYSGVGIDDEIAKSSNELNFVQQLKLASGYNIICASASDAPAKEASDIKNGRLTRLFIDIIQNKLNYTDGILNLSRVFQRIDEAFKHNPTFRQYPFSQTKGLSTYPISFQEEGENINYFSTHYIEDVEDYDWDSFKNDLLHYCTIKRETVNEFTRLVRELLRNCKKWSNASFTKVEISRNSVSIIDNSGTHFDIFNPPPSTKLRGGGKTARVFNNHYSKEFDYEYYIKASETIQEFKFIDTPFTEESCALVIEDIFELWEFQRGRTIEIPEHCKEYSIVIPQGFLDLSTVFMFMRSAILSSQKFDKKIILNIDQNDKLKDEFIDALKYNKELGEHKVTII